jgi:hypothetical protein
MDGMRDAMRKSWWVVTFAVLLIAVGLGWAQDDEDEGPLSNLSFVVLKDYNGKPVRNAAVVLHPVKKNGDQTKGGMELKTDDDGRTHIDGIPYGPLRIQVLVPGFQTFGEDYKIDKPELEITVRLKKPKGQYSTYGNSGDQSKGNAPNSNDQKPQ